LLIDTKTYDKAQQMLHLLGVVTMMGCSIVLGCFAGPLLFLRMWLVINVIPYIVTFFVLNLRMPVAGNRPTPSVMQEDAEWGNDNKFVHHCCFLYYCEWKVIIRGFFLLSTAGLVVTLPSQAVFYGLVKFYVVVRAVYLAFRDLRLFTGYNMIVLLIVVEQLLSPAFIAAFIAGVKIFSVAAAKQLCTEVAFAALYAGAVCLLFRWVRAPA